MKFKFLLFLFPLSIGLLFLNGGFSRADSPTSTPEAKPLDDGPVQIESSIAEPEQVTTNPLGSNSPEIVESQIELAGDLSTSAFTPKQSISIDTSSYEDSNPAIAYCNGTYLVVWAREDDGQIWGQRLDASGNKAGGAFQISTYGTPSSSSTKPDVACDYHIGRYLVVWQHYLFGSDNIYGRTVYYHHQLGDVDSDVTTISGTSSNETEPAVACNYRDHSCLVVFKYNNADIYGQHVAVSSGTMSNSGSRFGIATWSGEQEYEPDVAWGRDSDNYMVVWRAFYDGRYRILFNLIYETYQSSGSQLQYTPPYLLNNLASSLYDPAVAYNQNNDSYLIVYEYSTYGIYGTRVQNTATNPSYIESQQFFDVTTNSGYANEYDPAVAYVPNINYSNSSGGVDRFLVTYRGVNGSAGDAILAQAIYGTDVSGSTMERDGDPVILFQAGLGYYSPYNPDVTGAGYYPGTGSQSAIVVWDAQKMYGDHSDDVLGYVLEPGGDSVYLPLVIKN